MRIKIVFISEALSFPFDEGIKNVTFALYEQLKRKIGALTITNAENVIDDDKVCKLKLNKLFLNYKLRACIKAFAPHSILYLPESSITFASLLRAKILKIIAGASRLVVIGLQHREYFPIQDLIVKRFLKPDLILLLGKSDEEYYKNKGFKVKILPPAVDIEKYCPATIGEKEKIRSEFNISKDKFVILHIGHIKVNRNIECLMEVQKIDNVQVIVVGSTSIIVEKNIKNRLLDAGIIVIDKYIKNISDIYKMSDLYVFPVKSEKEAIEMPLSVLEAMACELPIITTRFQGLVEHFREDESFKFFNDENELVELVKNMYGIKAGNSKKIKKFTWDAFSDEIITAMRELS